MFRDGLVALAHQFRLLQPGSIGINAVPSLALVLVMSLNVVDGFAGVHDGEGFGAVGVSWADSDECCASPQTSA